MTRTPLTDPDCPHSVRDQINGGVTQEAPAEFEDAIRLLEVGEYLYEARAYSYGNGYDEPREYGIDWQWQQSKPNEYGQGVLLAEAVAWHEQMLADGSETQATKLRRFLTTAQAEREQLEARDIGTYYARQIEWSRNTFGPALRTKGVIDHIRKELGEIEAEPHDLSEWVDVIILAMDGFWRHGGTADALMPALLAKQRKNMARTWPDWRTRSEDQAIEHDRSNDAALQEQRP